MHTSEVDAPVLCSWLDARDIACVVQGGHHVGHSMGSDIVEVRVLVARRDLEWARTLLESKVETPEVRAALDACVREGAPPAGLVPGEISTAVYFGDDTLLSARGDVHGLPPRYEDRQEHTRAVPSQKWRSRRQDLLVRKLSLSVIVAPVIFYGLLGLLGLLQ